MFAHPSVVFEQVRKGFNPAATRPYARARFPEMLRYVPGVIGAGLIS